ncbi:hypothetical protein F4820DRAFT_454700 [Hypoxylon rubiginosum]|uniref:Uncharacterized protein n=1 Tax=Hypoxylon rubiginosum TaxID=110542 RepID=A0ACB9YI45_9PEZI|nr:hypothetical protein F4820DRAFT_454700 [Hypoxylon rubiginosum]
MDSYYSPGSRPFVSGSQSFDEADAEAIRHDRQSRQSLITFLCKHCTQIEDSIKQLARFVFLSNFPVKVQWDLVRCTVETVHTFATPEPHFRLRPYRVTTLDEFESATENDEDAYALCIRIQLPDDIQQDDRKVTLMRDILVRDEERKYGFLSGIPFQGHPIYGLFSIQLTKDIMEKDISIFDGTVWSLANAVFLPVPDTIRDRISTQYLLHHMNIQSGIKWWRSEMDRRRIMRGVRYVESEASQDHHSYHGRHTRHTYR